jgi:signal transduction histidine kinase
MDWSRQTSTISSVGRSASTRQLLVQRTRGVLLLCLLVGALFAALEWCSAPRPLPPSYFVKMLGLGLAATAFGALGRRWAVRHAWVLSIGIVAIAYVITGISGMVAPAHDYVTTAVLFVGAALTTATVIPWGAGPQLATVAVGMAVLAGAVVRAEGSLHVAATGVATVAAFVLSVLMAREVNRYRLAHQRELRVRRKSESAVKRLNAQLESRVQARTAELRDANSRLTAEILERHRAEDALREEAQIASALARVGREMISSLDTPALLDRLCQIAADVLQCDMSYTLMRRSGEHVYIPVAGYGGTPEEQAVARSITVPASLLSVLVSRLDPEDVAVVHTVPRELLGHMTQEGLGLSAQLCMALRRGRELIGIQIANSRGRVGPFTSRQRRIAQGIAHLASLALENARLVEELEQASRVKSEFVATMSHELRTPLGAILGYTGLLLEGDYGALTGEQQDILRRVDRKTETLLDLITATLDLSRLEAGPPVLKARPVVVPELLAEVDAETRELQEKSGLHFVWNVARDLPQLRTDPRPLKMVLKNLIGNATKFTERGGVTVGASPRDGGVEIAVADTGIGIAPEALPVIFERFRQADSSHTRRFGGVGLGLYIVQRSLEMLGGSISVESEVGRGSTFRVWLPTALIAESR